MLLIITHRRAEETPRSRPERRPSRPSYFQEEAFWRFAANLP